MVIGSLPTLMPPCWDLVFYLTPSVGMEAIGAVLMQKDPKTSFMRLIYFASKVMTQVERGYTPVEQMVLALMSAVRKFR